MSYRELLALPIRTFWSLNKNVERIRAQTDIRSLYIQSAANASGEGRGQLLNSLNKELGVVIKVDEGRAAVAKATSELDRQGLAELKALGARIVT